MSKSNSVGTELFVNEIKVGGLTDINGIKISADATDVTDLGNKDGYREKLPGFKDAGDVPVSGYMDGDDKGQDECYRVMQSGEVVPCKIVFPDKIGKTWSFNAGLTEFSTDVKVDGAISFGATLAVSGKPTLAATATLAAKANGKPVAAAPIKE